jgi:two-component system chemotaxis response regulator CheY
MSSRRALARLKNYRLKVLIADDNIEARRGTRLMLSIHPGVEVTAIAQNGRQAVEMAHTYPPDIVIMDINMPELDGLSAMHELRSFLPDALYIVMSAERESKMIGQAIEAGANEYLVKPFTYEDLDKAIRGCAQTWFARRMQSASAASRADADQQNLLRLAHVYSQARRTDSAALDVFERLATQPDCELRWLLTLAMIYVVRQQWGKLKHLAERMERRTIHET